MAYGSTLYVNGQPIAAPYMLAHVPAVSGLGAFWNKKAVRDRNKARRAEKKAQRAARKPIRQAKRKAVLKKIGKVVKTAGAVTAAITLSPATLLVTTKAGRKASGGVIGKLFGKKKKPAAKPKGEMDHIIKAKAAAAAKVVAVAKKPLQIKSTPKSKAAAAQKAAAAAIQAEAPLTAEMVATDLEPTGMALTTKLALAGAGVVAVGGLAYLLLRKPKMAANRSRRRRSRRSHRR